MLIDCGIFVPSDNLAGCFYEVYAESDIITKVTIISPNGEILACDCVDRAGVDDYLAGHRDW